MPLATTTYAVVVAFHVIFVVVGIGSTFALPIIGSVGAGNPQTLPFSLDVTVKLVRYITSPFAVLVLLTGLYQVSDGPYKLSDTWLGLSFVLFIVLMGIVGAVLIPASVRAKAEAERILSEGGEFVATPALQADLKKGSTFGPILGVGWLVIVYLMMVKPF